MPTTVTVHDAKTNLSELLRRVEAGEEIVIARGATPVAILRGYLRDDIAARRKAAFGCLAGHAPVPDESVFFGPVSDEDFAKMFGEEFRALHADLEIGKQGA
jgi:prevent-host-death family protein